MTLRDELVLFCHKVYKNGFVAATDGNLSVRTDDNAFFVTASGICKGDVTTEHILRCDKDGNTAFNRGRVSTEFKLHSVIYENRKEIQAVVHCHPVFATAIATSSSNFDQPIFPEVVLGIGRIPLAKYATPSTDEVPQSILPFIPFANAILLENHGAVTVGRTLQEAYNRMEKLEHAAKIFFYAELAGGAKRIPEEKLPKLYEAAEKTYNITIDNRNKF